MKKILDVCIWDMGLKFTILYILRSRSDLEVFGIASFSKLFICSSFFDIVDTQF